MGEVVVGGGVFPGLDPEGDILMHAAFVKPEGSPPAVKILHHTVICLARKKIWIQNPYFIPEPEAIDAFGQAVSRGVDVRVTLKQFFEVHGCGQPVLVFHAYQC